VLFIRYPFVDIRRGILLSSFGRWAKCSGGQRGPDRLVHHAEVVALKGDSYRLKDPWLGERA
jgi:DNA replication protein DnaC